MSCETGLTDVVLTTALALVDRFGILADASSGVRDLHPLQICLLGIVQVGNVYSVTWKQFPPLP